VLPIWILAQEPFDEQIVVEATAQLSEAREVLDLAIRDEGYVRLFRLGKTTRYVPPRIWRPWVTVHEWGYVRVKGRQLTPVGFKRRGNVWSLHFVWDTERGVQSAEWAVLEDILPAVREWDEARLAQGLAVRRVEVRGTLVTLWETGLTPHATVVLDWPERRAYIAELWLHTADNADGATIRGDISVFVDDVVQATAPYTAEEIAAVDSAHSFGTPFAPTIR
jgi:hypothetical protein